MKYVPQTFITVPNRYSLETVSGTAQAIYLWLCHMQNDTGKCWPTVNKLAELTRTGRTRVKQACKELEQAGLISQSLSFKEGQGQQANLYEVLIKDTEPVAAADDYRNLNNYPQPKQKNPSRHTTTPQSKRVTPVAKRPPPQSPHDHPPVATRPQTKPILTKHIHTQSSTKKTNVCVRETFDFYCKTFNQRLLYTNARSNSIKNRLKDFSPEKIREAITNASNDEFYNGAGERGWRGNIDYLFKKSENIEKYLLITNLSQRGLGF